MVKRQGCSQHGVLRFRNLVDGYRTVYETSRQHHAVSVTDLLHERTDIEIIEIAAELVGNTLETASPRTQTSASSSISSQQELSQQHRHRLPYSHCRR